MKTIKKHLILATDLAIAVAIAVIAAPIIGLLVIHNKDKYMPIMRQFLTCYEGTWRTYRS